MTSEQQAIYLNAVPLIALGAIYLAAAASLAPSVLRERRHVRELELALVLVFPCGGAAALIFALLVLRQGEPVGGQPWLALAAIVLALVPAIAFFARFRDRTLMLTGPRRAREAENQLSASERQLRAAGRVAGAATFGDAARMLVDEAKGLVGVDFGALMMIEAGGAEAYGVVGRSGDRDVDWLNDVRLDLRNEPSGVASAYHDAAAFAVYDAAKSEQVSQRLVERTHVKSTAYVPLLFERRVIGVLVLGSLQSPRAFSAEELAAVQGLAGDVAGVLEQLRSTTDVGAAIERERIVGAIATRLRSAGGVDEVLDVAVREVGRALAVQRSYVRIDRSGDDESGPAVVRAQWQADQLEPIPAQTAARLPVANLSVREQRTIGVTDASIAPELDDESLGGRETLLRLGARAVAAAPIVLFGRCTGVFSVHRTQPGAWPAGHLALIEAVAREIGFALETATLLDENARRLERERALFRLVSALGETVSLQATLDALAPAAADVHSAAAAAVLVPGSEGLALASSHGLPGKLRDALDDGELREDALLLASTNCRLLASASLSGDTRFGERWRRLADEAGLGGLLVIPVEDPRATTATLVVVFFAEERTLDDADMELARHLGAAARAALERAGLFEAERTSRSLSQQLARSGGLLATELDPAAILDEVVAQAPLLVGADACAIFTLEADELVVAAASGADAASVVGARTELGSWLSGDVVQSRRPVIVEDVRTSAPAAADPLLTEGYRSYVGLPLLGSEAALHGVLALYARAPRSWRPEVVEALQALAANASAALSNAELYQRVALEKERSAAILENIADGIVAVDRDGDVVLWNKAAEEITGVPAADALGGPPERALGRAIEGEGLVTIPSGGREIWLSVTEAVMRDPAGLVAGRIYAFRDISSERLVEQVKSEFVTTVSHELRTPLTSIYGFAETLLREDVLFGDEERKVFLRYIASESERLTQIVEALLDVARLDTGDLFVNLAPTEVAPVLTEVVSNAEGGGGNGHRFVVDVPPEPIAAEADADKLRQVLSHLVENAVKYSPAGGTVRVCARRNDDRVEFEVEDEGIGIPEAERDRIFRKFYRASSASGHDTLGGTGLGLFIVHELVNAMGGRIWVDSAEGEGSRFAFELPAARV